MTVQVEERLREMKEAVDHQMEKILAADDSPLFEAMRYAVLSGGKRFRPLLVLSTGESFGGSRELLLPFACAIEFIHNYSLIHDDLPAMDNDDFRRGRPSCHRAFGEDVAILAGDSLLTLAFEVMLQAPVPEDLLARKVEAIREVSRLAGPGGMIAGQFLDITLPPDNISEEDIFDLMEKKTGALIVASVKVGALIGGAPREAIAALEDFGRRLGLAFQIRDDILDASFQEKVSSVARPNFVRIFGLQRARQLLEKLVGEAGNGLAAAGLLSEELEYLSFKLLDVARI